MGLYALVHTFEAELMKVLKHTHQSVERAANWTQKSVIRMRIIIFDVIKQYNSGKYYGEPNQSWLAAATAAVLPNRK